MDQHRAERVSETVREELAEIIGFELSDPRLAVVDVNVVQVAPDLKHAHVLVALSGDEREQKAAMAALEHARHYLRHELARRLNLRKIPELHFEPGPGPAVAERVELLLKRAKKLRRPTENPP
ncbi:MAG TPA: 30S ribosome-binding factor RbfA [Bryobacteraceae bacterium]|nr:30S ribosome-binding factor RbfA [Bryobacteraceae bacterium]